MTATARVNTNSSFAGWSTWVGFVAFACVVGYLSISSHLVDRETQHLERLADTLSNLNEQSRPMQSSKAQWVIKVHQLLPTLAFYTDDVADRVLEPLNEIAATVASQKPFTEVQQIALRREMLDAEVRLKELHARLDQKQTQITHFYYWSLLAFVIFAFRLVYAKARLSAQRSASYDWLMKDSVLFDALPTGIALANRQDQLVRVNEAYEKGTGFQSQDLIGRPSCEPEPQGMREALQDDGVWVGERTIRREDGAVIAEKVMRMTLGEPSSPEGFLTMSMEPLVSDDERRLMLWQAHHDNLTKLPNANLLHERLSRGLTTLPQDQTSAALISIDIDGFQQVNDSVGHEIADRILTDAAYRIAMAARETDTVARVGGDIFVIALLELDSIADAEQMARTAIENFKAPFFAEERELFLSASAGITLFPDDGLDRGELLQKADAARLQAKKEGGNRFVFFEEQLNSDAERRLEIETHLRRAIENDELKLFYQPIIDCVSGKVYGAEALLRWENEALGFVSPGEFIPVAEASGLIVEIGDWVARTAARQRVPGLSSKAGRSYGCH